MDTLVAVGTSAGYLYSTAVIFGVITGGLYFEAVAFILWFIYLGVWLEARSKARASALRNCSRCKQRRPPSYATARRSSSRSRTSNPAT